MPSTYEPIASVTVGTATSFIEFASIASTYTDLRIILQSRSTDATFQSNVTFQINVDSGTNYSQTFLIGNGSSASSARNTSQTVGIATQSTGTLATGEWEITAFDFMNYANSNTFKTILIRDNSASLSTTACVNLWRSTAAINNIRLFKQIGNHSVGTIATLYGVKSA
jgi:hypothetical protein